MPIQIPAQIDLERIARAVREILEAVGEDPDRDGLVRTPERVAKMYGEVLAGLHEDPAEHLSVTFEGQVTMRWSWLKTSRSTRYASTI